MPHNDVLATGEANEIRISYDELCPRICVREPYYALRSLTEDASGLHAQVQVEQPLGDEVGPICSAEAGRHLAILGLCAVARDQATGEKNYYLAKEAHFVRADRAELSAQDALFASAHVTKLDRRSASAATSLHHGSGVKLLDVAVNYQILSQRTFERLFAAHRVELRSGPRQTIDLAAAREQRRNPYREAFVLQDLRVHDTCAEAALGVVTPAQCNGHFPLYPALPVARVMQALVDACWALLRHRTGATRFCILEGRTNAHVLAFAGQHVRLRVELDYSRANGERYRAQATNEAGHIVGEVLLDMESRRD